MSEQSKKSSMHVKPLMYIHQPGIQTVEIKAQSIYRVGKEEKEKQDEQALSSTSEQLHYPQETTTEKEVAEVEKIIEMVSTEKDLSDEEEIVQVRKPFKEMNIREKIHHVIHRPTYIPTPLCEVLVEGESVVGYIVKEQEDYIFIRLTSSVEMRVIEIKEIVDLRLVM